MDIQFFHTFLRVAKLGNMTHAAEELNFTQPTITGQIRALEQHFGVMLFDRVGKKLYITDAGRELVEYAEKLLTIYGEAQASLNAHPCNIKIGVGSSSVNYFLVPYLQAFQQQTPACSVILEVCANKSVVVKGISENRFDLGLIPSEKPLDASLAFLSGFEVYKEQIVWVVHATLAEKYHHSQNIFDYPILDYKSGGLLHKFYEKILGLKQNTPTIAYSDSEAMKSSILQGLGCGALPLNLARTLLEDGSLLEFARVPRAFFSIWVVYHKEKMLSRATLNLIQILQKAGNL